MSPYFTAHKVPLTPHPLFSGQSKLLSWGTRAGNKGGSWISTLVLRAPPDMHIQGFSCLTIYTAQVLAEAIWGTG